MWESKLVKPLPPFFIPVTPQMLQLKFSSSASSNTHEHRSLFLTAGSFLLVMVETEESNKGDAFQMRG
jgi:hypothetical protein